MDANLVKWEQQRRASKNVKIRCWTKKHIRKKEKLSAARSCSRFGLFFPAFLSLLSLRWRMIPKKKKKSALIFFVWCQKNGSCMSVLITWKAFCTVLIRSHCAADCYSVGHQSHTGVIDLTEKYAPATHTILFTSVCIYQCLLVQRTHQAANSNQQLQASYVSLGKTKKKNNSMMPRSGTTNSRIYCQGFYITKMFGRTNRTADHCQRGMLSTADSSASLRVPGSAPWTAVMTRCCRMFSMIPLEFTLWVRSDKTDAV